MSNVKHKTSKHKTSKRRTRSKNRRVKPPRDWVAFLRPVIEELPVALEILERLRWAAKLQEKGVEVAPGVLKPRHYESRLPWQPSDVNASRAIWTLKELKTPEEMAKTIERDKLKRLLATWEIEVAAWGRAIIGTLGETLRLRQERSELLDLVEQTTRFFPDIGDFEAARIQEQLRSNPERPVETKHGIISRAIVMLDEFGNELQEGPDEELLAEISKEPRDERVLRRILKGEKKKAVGGILDIDEGLLRSGPDTADKRRDRSVLDLTPPKTAK